MEREREGGRAGMERGDRGRWGGGTPSPFASPTPYPFTPATCAMFSCQVMPVMFISLYG